MEAKIRHLEMIRSAIDGAAGNSLRIKGFAMLLLAGAIAFLIRDDMSASVIPVHFAVILWVFVAILFSLDAYFIRQSDLFGILYNQVMRRSEDDIDFSMDLTQCRNETPEPQNEELSLYLIATLAFYLIILAILIIGALPLTSTNSM